MNDTMIRVGSHYCDRAILDDPAIAELYQDWKSLEEARAAAAGEAQAFDYTPQLRLSLSFLDNAVLRWFMARPASYAPVAVDADETRAAPILEPDGIGFARMAIVSLVITLIVFCGVATLWPYIPR